MKTLIIERRSVLAFLIMLLLIILMAAAIVYGESLWRAFSEEPAEIPKIQNPAAVIMKPVLKTDPLKINSVPVQAVNHAASGLNISPETGLRLPAAAVSAQSKSDQQQFFAQFRLERDRVRSQEIDLLKEMVKLPNTSPDVNAEAQKRLMELSLRTEKEMELENLMVAKGFPEATAIIQAEVSTLVLMSSTLSEEQKKPLINLAASIIGCAPEQITIIFHK